MNAHFSLFRISLSFLILSCLCQRILAQERFIDPNKGNIIYTKKGILDGNFVRTIYLNHGEIALWPDKPSGEWPKGTGHQYVDGIAVIVQAEVQDSAGNTVHPLETNYREFIRTDPVTKVPWGWAPLPGYANPAQAQPALSNNPATWPTTWPDRPPDWNGLWNGFFGRGIQNADLETYFRMDDSPDKQYTYRPDPADPDRGGLGLQVAVRGFQWSQVLAADVIFWYYEITNIAKQDHTKVVFAQYVDWGIGGTEDSSDDRGLFDTELDIAWAFDGDGIGQPANWSPVGVAGYAFLESPGISNNTLDDDEDGLLEERRDNDAGSYLDTYPYGIQDVDHFKRFYGRDPSPHWSGDENGDWRPFSDVNDNGAWDEGEPLNDDVGTDGLGPFDAAYTGPDADGSQGNGKPEQGETSFGILDKDESDQIGLTGFSIFPVHFYELHNDEQNWQVLTKPIDTTGFQQLNDVNLGMYFSAGARQEGGFPGNLFPLRRLQTERFSMALLFGDDRNDLVRRKRTVQQIYNANYRFAKPPEKPRLVAVPGDRKVVLYWDTRAEISFDPFLQEFDFEGYRIYRSTDQSFLESLVITDAYGKSTFRKPIAQFDLVDSIQGLHPIDVNGVKFDLGNESGLRHTFVDTDVQNGQTYYYAVVSYDRGFYTVTTAGEIDGIAPSECTSIVQVDINGNVRTDVNTAVVTPSAPAAGYLPPGLDGEILHSGPGTGRIEVQVLDTDSLRSGHTYNVTFANASRFQNDPVPTFSLVDVTDGRTLVDQRRIVADGEETGIVDGFIGFVYNEAETEISSALTGWTTGQTTLLTPVDTDPAFPLVSVRYPADFEVRIAATAVDTSTGGLFFGSPAARPCRFTIWNLTENVKAQFMFYDNDNDSSLTIGDRVTIVHGDSLGKKAASGSYRTSWRIRLLTNPDAGSQIPPSPGDVFRVTTTKPFRTGEAFQFVIRGDAVDQSKAKSELDKIAVVPNPYVGAASWEPRELFRTGRGERRIYFVNLPAQCTIRIYTVRGYLVKELKHESASNIGQEPWNLVSKDGMDISYGVYVYHVEAPGIGETIGRFAVIK